MKLSWFIKWYTPKHPWNSSATKLSWKHGASTKHRRSGLAVSTSWKLRIGSTNKPRKALKPKKRRGGVSKSSRSVVCGYSRRLRGPSVVKTSRSVYLALFWQAFAKQWQTFGDFDSRHKTPTPVTPLKINPVTGKTYAGVLFMPNRYFSVSAGIFFGSYSWRVFGQLAPWTISTEKSGSFQIYLIDRRTFRFLWNIFATRAIHLDNLQYFTLFFSSARASQFPSLYISGAIPESLGQLLNLVSLYLYNNQLSGEGLAG